MDVVKVNYGLGSAYPMGKDSFIEINHKLSKELEAKIIKHEQRHSRNRQYSKEDFKNDFQSKNSYFKDSLKFCLFNYEAWIGFFPLMYSYYLKIFTWNSSAFFPYLWFGLIFSGFFSIIFKVNFFKALLGYSVLFVCMNLILLWITHMYVKRDKSFVYKREQ